MGFDNLPQDQISLKVAFGEEIRRLTILGTNYGTLCDKIGGLFGLAPSHFCLKYLDDDNDKITMSCDTEFHEAIRIAAKMEKGLRLFVEVKTAAQNVQQPEPQTTSNNADSEAYQAPPGRFGLPPSTTPPPNANSTEIQRQQHGRCGDDRRHHHRHHHPGHSHRWGRSDPLTTTSTTSATSPPSQSSGADSSSFRAYKESKLAYKESKKIYKANKHALVDLYTQATTDEDRKKYKEMLDNLKQQRRQVQRDMKWEIDSLKALKISCKDKHDEKKHRYVARHVEDVTIPDGTELPPNTPFIKTWKIRNGGPTWPAGCHLLFVSHKADNLNGPERVTIKGEVLSGQEVEVSVPLITPSEPGRYVGYYRMVTPDGAKFGQRVWVSFFVKRQEPASSFNSVAKICDDVNA